MAADSSRDRRPAWGKIAAMVLLALALAAAWRFTPLSDYFTASRIGSWARWLRELPWAPAIVIAVYTPSAFVMFPRPLLTLMTVIAFGPWLGFAYSMAGIIVSAYATYYAGRLLKPQAVSRLAGRHFEPVKRALQRHGFAATLAVRLVAVAPFVIEGIIAGAMRVGPWGYGLGTFLGMLPGVLATTVFGNQIAAAIESPDDAVWWIAGAALLALVAMTWLVKRWFQREGR